ncbi:lactonase family protein [Steroidobacter flavus]|uniref:Lactonase family protein n=1 Tax=Steroidobacter flavus TaxID=1842136 RepID=A0ABV8SNT2_9GAMM
MWRAVLLTIVLISVFAAGPSRAAEQWVYFGNRSTEPGQGIVAARFDTQSGRLTPVGVVADVSRPTWLLAHPTLPVLYSVSEPVGDAQGESSVISLGVEKVTGKLSVLNKVASGGGGATHLTFDADTKSMFVAHFRTGNVSWLPVAEDGRLGELYAKQNNSGTGPHRRQTSPHAHGVVVDPSRRYVLCADLGADRVFVYRFDTATHQLTPGTPPFVSLAPGSGPRHLAFHPSGEFVFLVTELSADLVSYRWDAKSGTLQQVQLLPLDEPSFTGTKNAAHIQTSRDGRFIYASNRGASSMQVYAVDEAGKLTEVQRISATGKTPWDFSLDPSGQWLLVANTGSNSINVFAVDPASGKLTPGEAWLPVNQPSNVTFLSGAD